MQAIPAVGEGALGERSPDLPNVAEVGQDRREPGRLDGGECRASHAPGDNGRTIQDSADHSTGMGILSPVFMVFVMIALVERLVTTLTGNDLPIFNRQYLKIARPSKVRTDLNAIICGNGDFSRLAHFYLS